MLRQLRRNMDADAFRLTSEKAPRAKSYLRRKAQCRSDFGSMVNERATTNQCNTVLVPGFTLEFDALFKVELTLENGAGLRFPGTW